METRLAFGKEGLRVTLPDSHQYRVLHSISAPPLADAVAAIEAALDRPAAGPPLAAVAAGKTSAAISAFDITRAAPKPLEQPPLLCRLGAARNAPRHIRILI